MADTRSRRMNGILSTRWLIGAGVCLLVVSGCGKVATGGSQAVRAPVNSPASASATPSALPHFSDWRMAYLAPDGRAHIVTLDGKTDLTGPLLPDLASYGRWVSNAGVEGEGKTVAYGGDTGLDLVDLTGQTAPHAVRADYGFNHILWSPKHDKVYSEIGEGRFFYLTLATGRLTTVTPRTSVAGAIGWIDDTHVADVSFQGAPMIDEGAGFKKPTFATLVSLDIASGRARTITTIQRAGVELLQWSSSPDGSQVLYYNGPYQDHPYAPRVALITLATGHVSWLPTIAQATGAGFSSVAWRPGSDTLAVSINHAAEQGGVATWLLDVAADTATRIHAPGMVMAWAPDNGPLVVSSGYQSEVGSGPYTLWALTCPQGAQCSATKLTERAMTFDFLGFVRNP